MMKTIYIYENGAVIKKSGERIVVQKEGMLLKSEPLINVEAIAVLDEVQITGQLMVALMEKGIPVFYMKKSGRILGNVLPEADKNIFLLKLSMKSWELRELRRIVITNCYAGALKECRFPPGQNTRQKMK